MLSHLWTVAPETAFPIALRTAPKLVRTQGVCAERGSEAPACKLLSDDCMSRGIIRSVEKMKVS